MIVECRGLELIVVLGSQSAGDMCIVMGCHCLSLGPQRHTCPSYTRQ